MNKERKNLKAFSASLLLCALTICTLALPAHAGTWFSESEYAYFGGRFPPAAPDQWPDLMVYPAGPGTIGSDPAVKLEVLGLTCFMTEFTDVQFNYDGKDFYIAGTWEIQQKGKIVHTDNASDIVPNMVGMNITKVAIVTNEADISDIKCALTEKLHISDITLIYFTDNFTTVTFGKYPDETGKFLPGFGLGVDGLTLGNIDMGITNGKKIWGGYFDSVIFVGEGVSPFSDSRIEINLPSVTAHVLGEVYVTGNWTAFAATIEDIGTFVGKVFAAAVKYGSIVLQPDFGNRTTIVDYDSGISAPDPRGDINKDGTIDIVDITFVAARFDTAIGQDGYDLEADLNKDGVIDILDIAIPAKDFGKSI